MQKKLLIIFSRSPVLGKVKQRLAIKLGKEKALKIHKKLLAYTLNIGRKSGITNKIYFSDSPNINPTFDYDLQIGADLGERMNNAFTTELNKNDMVCLIGSDCLVLTANDISNAFQQLNACDIVIGPAIDGGYYLIGMKNTHQQLFSDVSWGTATVLEETLRLCKQNKLSFTLLRPLNDVDHPEDLPVSWL